MSADDQKSIQDLKARILQKKKKNQATENKSQELSQSISKDKNQPNIEKKEIVEKNRVEKPNEEQEDKEKQLDELSKVNQENHIDPQNKKDQKQNSILPENKNKQNSGEIGQMIEEKKQAEEEAPGISQKQDKTNLAAQPQVAAPAVSLDENEGQKNRNCETQMVKRMVKDIDAIKKVYQNLQFSIKGLQYIERRIKFDKEYRNKVQKNLPILKHIGI